MQKRTYVLIFCLAALSSELLTHAETAPMGDNLKSVQDVTRADVSPQDERLTAEVKQALRDDSGLRQLLQNIQLKTVNGIVHMKGSVNSEADKLSLENKVRSLPGVSEIKSFIRIAGH